MTDLSGIRERTTIKEETLMQKYVVYSYEWTDGPELTVDYEPTDGPDKWHEDLLFIPVGNHHASFIEGYTAGSVDHYGESLRYRNWLQQADLQVFNIEWTRADGSTYRETQAAYDFATMLECVDETVRTDPAFTAGVIL